MTPVKVAGVAAQDIGDEVLAGNDLLIDIALHAHLVDRVPGRGAENKEQTRECGNEQGQTTGRCDLPIQPPVLASDYNIVGCRTARNWRQRAFRQMSLVAAWALLNRAVCHPRSRYPPDAAQTGPR